MGLEKVPIKLSYDDLRTYTDNFSDENFISEFQFGKIYHGKITLPGLEQPKPVTVKIWEIPKFYAYLVDDNLLRLMDEVVFLQQHSHPGLMKLYGYCCKTEQCGVVYDFKSRNTVYNLTMRDEFKWWQRIKVALKFAQLLRFLHVKHPREKPLVIRNLSAVHIMVDEDCSIKLYDFGMVTGGPFPDRTKLVSFLWGCRGYDEPMGQNYSPKSDVHAFGVILLSMIMKEVYTDEERSHPKPSIIERAFCKYEGYSLKEAYPEEEGSDDDIESQVDNFRFSLVHESFAADESFCASDGPIITRLGLSCAEMYPESRPTIKQVIRRLQKLKVVRTHLNYCIERKMKKENIPFP